MKIISWNCNGALRKKFGLLDETAADLYIIQECEDPSRSDIAYREWAGNYLWSGLNKNKGIGVFSPRGWTLRQLDWPDGGLQSFLPFEVDGSARGLAVWTKHAGSPNFRYIGQFWKYLQMHRGLIAEAAFICGDFNSNVQWDEWDRWWNHSDVVRELSEMGLHSLYHAVSGEAQGAETVPTLLHLRKTDRPFHIDYFFLSETRCALNGSSLQILTSVEWTAASDHMPLVAEISDML